ncbi:DUF4190 domain-containing protein [Candidatus Neomicrothrix sp.]|uniref:DUF4190 domain-containing protein n=1 Tax=Candidatus Neomicrothrix sp. TaxID=2719034 RepID=UPI0025C31D96|nr:DUF4190 domain-containing protein [Candidatus Microthrix sp.]
MDTWRPTPPTTWRSRRWCCPSLASPSAPLCYLPILLAPVGAIIGHMALNRIKTSGQEGRGLALAGIIIGWFGTRWRWEW